VWVTKAFCLWRVSSRLIALHLQPQSARAKADPSHAHPTHTHTLNPTHQSTHLNNPHPTHPPTPPRYNEGVPLLATLVSGRSARAAETASDEEMQAAALEVRGGAARCFCGWLAEFGACLQ